ncbi:hypothetical protein HFO56_18525 [Rhizobium laguerreae]|uniref:hypothetical protein n=1 Tax=Rhizobium laguerreae TaxID=1076926 RepID=UPI001C918821|nr:hypothetical protein [Rhizobium laguerreae]MBY3154336.1 hypothetical protein [Rhizobium laguerreae]
MEYPLHRALFCAAAFLVVGCAELPQQRNENELPRAQVLARIKCELVNAVIAVSAQQASPDLETLRTRKYFNMPNYTATIVLHDQSDVSEAAVIGGSRQYSDNSFHRKFAGGASEFPGLGLSGHQQQYNEATRTVPFKDIISPPVRSDETYGLVDSDLTSACTAAGFKPTSRVGTVGVGAPLGITERLSKVLEDTKAAPSFVAAQKMHFEFTVVVGAGGTFSFVHPLRQEDFGLGGNNSFHETLDIAIAPNAGG